MLSVKWTYDRKSMPKTSIFNFENGLNEMCIKFTKIKQIN